VTKVHPTAFTATCRLRTGEGQKISAQWQASGSADIAGGVIQRLELLTRFGHGAVRRAVD
jgi:hypothetical protein